MRKQLSDYNIDPIRLYMFFISDIPMTQTGAPLIRRICRILYIARIEMWQRIIIKEETAGAISNIKNTKQSAGNNDIYT